MLTRSAAKKLKNATLLGDGASVVISPSATGKGHHMRWHYPTSERAPLTPTKEVPFYSLDNSSNSSFSSLSSGSSSTLSSASPSLSSSFSDDSFHAPPTLHTHASHPRPPSTPTQDAARKLQRSPGLLFQPDGNNRIIVVPDSFSPGVVGMRRSMKAREFEAVFQTQWQNMLAQKRQRELDVYGDSSTDGGSSDLMSNADSEMEFIREDTEPVEDMWTGDMGGSPLWRRKALGPHGTELIDETFRALPSVLPVYPQEWSAEANTERGLRWRPTEIVV